MPDSTVTTAMRSAPVFGCAVIVTTTSPLVPMAGLKSSQFSVEETLQVEGASKAMLAWPPSALMLTDEGVMEISVSLLVSTPNSSIRPITSSQATAPRRAAARDITLKILFMLG